MRVTPRLLRAACGIALLPLSAALAGESDGVRAFVDPVTGELRAPTAAELAAQPAAPAKAATAPEFFTTPDGTPGLRVPERHYFAVTVNPDGTLSSHHVEQAAP